MSSHPKISQDGTHVNGSSSPPDLERFVTDDGHTPAYVGKQPSTSTGTNKAAQQQQGGLITVQPLAKASLQPSYAQDLGTGSVGAYPSSSDEADPCCARTRAFPTSCFAPRATCFPHPGF
jgi:hypothetical protein